MVAALCNSKVSCLGFSVLKGRKTAKHLPELRYGVCAGRLLSLLEDALLQHGWTSSISFSFKSPSVDDAHGSKVVPRARDNESSTGEDILQIVFC